MEVIILIFKADSLLFLITAQEATARGPLRRALAFKPT